MERWKSIAINPIYEVSDEGNVRRASTKRLLAPSDCKGYPHVSLYDNRKRKSVTIHRLVADAFVDNPDNKPQVNHIDGNKYNNNYTNLEWCTASENMQHAFDTGLSKANCGMKGRKNPNGGRKDGVPVRIIETGQEFKSIADCEEYLTGDRTCTHLSDCLNGLQKTHCGYHFERI